MNRDKNYLYLIYQYIGKTTLVAVVFLFSILLGQFFLTSQNLIPLISPQIGVAIAVVLLLGLDSLPGILIGSFLIALSNGEPVGFSIFIALGNSLAAFFPTYFILNKNNFSFALEKISSILEIILLGVIFSPVISATFSILAMYSQFSIGENLPLIWLSRWTHDAFGVLLFTPFLLVWFGNSFPKISTEQLIEGISIFSVAVFIVFFVFFGKLSNEAANLVTFFIIPVIIWASIRLNIHGIVSFNLFISLLFLWGIANQNVALSSREISSYHVFLCVLGTMCVTSLILSSSIAKFHKTQKSLSDLSNHDPLTGLFNRLLFDTELKRLDKSRQFPISIIMVDVDNLKKVNDTFGHSTGDQILIKIANLLSSVFRQEDIISRIGGDEFVVLLPNTSMAVVKLIIERMNNRIDAYNIEHQELPIYISLGVSTASQGESLLGHLKISDDLMYKEKARKINDLVSR
jgi:diguanylate cyclase (GGDEF)-like protein